MRKILNQKVQAHIFLVDVKFQYNKNIYRVSCDYYSDSGVENIDVYKEGVYLTPNSKNNKEIYKEATEIIYEMNIKNK